MMDGPIRNLLILEQNHELLNDDLYLGIRRPRVRGKEYDDFIDTFVQSVSKLYPRAYLHLYVNDHHYLERGYAHLP